MARVFLIIGVLLLTGCEDIGHCHWYVPKESKDKHAELFDKCLMRAAEARKGVNYTTNDDEDYDEVIKQCSSSTRGFVTEWGCLKDGKVSFK